MKLKKGKRKLNFISFFSGNSQGSKERKERKKRKKREKEKKEKREKREKRAKREKKRKKSEKREKREKNRKKTEKREKKRKSLIIKDLRPKNAKLQKPLFKLWASCTIMSACSLTYVFLAWYSFWKFLLHNDLPFTVYDLYLGAAPSCGKFYNWSVIHE